MLEKNFIFFILFLFRCGESRCGYSYLFVLFMTCHRLFYLRWRKSELKRLLWPLSVLELGRPSYLRRQSSRPTIPSCSCFAIRSTGSTSSWVVWLIPLPAINRKPTMWWQLLVEECANSEDFSVWKGLRNKNYCLILWNINILWLRFMCGRIVNNHTLNEHASAIVQEWDMDSMRETGKKRITHEQRKNKEQY